MFGNEGDDWIEHGMADGSAGDNFDPRGRDSIVGNDVFIGDTVSDRMDGEGGDDIMIGNGGSATATSAAPASTGPASRTTRRSA